MRYLAGWVLLALHDLFSNARTATIIVAHALFKGRFQCVCEPSFRDGERSIVITDPINHEIERLWPHTCLSLNVWGLWLKSIISRE